jgi:membrane protease YdiL (CAAX protease family)
MRFTTSSLKINDRAYQSAVSVGYDPVMRQIILYMTTVYAYSWICWSIPVLTGNSALYLPCLILGAFGPWIAALSTLYLAGGYAEVRRWTRQTFLFRIPARYYLYSAILIPFAMGLLSQIYYWGFGGEFSISSSGWGIYVGSLIGTTLLTGGNEEPGWRGFLTPRFYRICSPVLANFLVSIIWISWHLPLFFLNGWSGGDQNLPLMYTYGFALSIILSYLYATSKSIIPVMILHAATNIIFDFFPQDEVVLFTLSLDFDIIKNMVYWTGAIIILLRYRGNLPRISGDYSSADIGE